MEINDYYEVLGCHSDASADEIKRSYRELASKLHPDLNSPRLKAWAERQMKQINEAYEVLGEPRRRSQYDKARLSGAFAPPRSDLTAPVPSYLANPLVRYAVTAVAIAVAFALAPALLRVVLLNPRGIAGALIVIGLWLAVSRLRRRNRQS